MTTIDMDALLAAEAEATQEPFEFTFKEQRFVLPPTLGVDFLMAVSRLNAEGVSSPDWDRLISAMFGSDKERFLGLKPDVRMLNRLIAEVTKHYAGSTAGESPASVAS